MISSSGSSSHIPSQSQKLTSVENEMRDFIFSKGEEGVKSR